jgi:hypothetical protein
MKAGHAYARGKEVRNRLAVLAQYDMNPGDNTMNYILELRLRLTNVYRFGLHCYIPLRYREHGYNFPHITSQLIQCCPL